GRWIWQDPWGWTWVSDEPWGWAPYHYGRWVTRASRWYWVPVAPNVRHVTYAPALVAFVGGGPGWSASVSIGGGGYVGWFPLGPRDPFVPWWGSQARAQIAPRNVVYANRSYVTVVNRGSFASAQPAQGDRVRDARVLQEIGGQAVLRGPLPVLPTPQSIRPAFATGFIPQPPARMATLAVTARLAPPPAPPSFTEKINVIRAGGGAPMTPAAAGTLAQQSSAGVRAALPIRPVTRDGGHVELAPRRDAVEVPPPDPIRIGRRPVASPQAPFIPQPSGPRENAPPMRVAPGAVTTPMTREVPPMAKPVPPVVQPVPPEAKPAPPVRGREDSPAMPVAAPPSQRPAAVAEPATRRGEEARPAPPRAEPQIQQQPQVQRQPQVQPQSQPERPAISRAPRRVAPAGPDPLQASGSARDDNSRGEKDKGDKDKGDKDKKDKPEKDEKK
ncbi:MAG: hypothetical protein PT977_08365, partial [Acidobacteriota bacterium]|nr:hypothetical protein [Acidobacteriota bacterium]